MLRRLVAGRLCWDAQIIAQAPEPHNGQQSSPSDSAQAMVTSSRMRYQAIPLISEIKLFLLFPRSSYSSYFRDITIGSNGNPAGTGYDLVTGLGSPITTNFVPVSTPDFSISAFPTSLTMNNGTSGTSTITVAALNGFTGTVTLSANAPSGWIVSFNPSIIPGHGTSILTIKVPSGASTGIYTLMVNGTCGALSHTTTIKVTVSSR